MSAWNAMLRATLRDHNDEKPDGPLPGRPLMSVTSSGAQSGQPREVALMFTRDGDRFVVAEGAEHDRLWAQHVAERPEFADYPVAAEGTIPVVSSSLA